MALTLGVKKGQKIRIAEYHTLTVLDVLGPDRVRINFRDRDILVTDKERARLLPEVFVQCGRVPRDISAQYSRLAFEAPKKIRIQRIAA